MAEGNAAAMKEKEQGNAAYKSKNFPKVLFSAVFDSGISINSKNKFVYYRNQRVYTKNKHVYSRNKYFYCKVTPFGIVYCKNKHF